MSNESENPFASSNFSEPHQGYNNSANVPDYLIWAILETLFCCVPFGVVGIIFSVMASSAKQTGDYNGAMQHAKNAKLYLTIGIVCWGVAILAYLAIMAIMFIVAAGGNMH